MMEKQPSDLRIGLIFLGSIAQAIALGVLVVGGEFALAYYPWHVAYAVAAFLAACIFASLFFAVSMVFWPPYSEGWRTEGIIAEILNAMSTIGFLTMSIPLWIIAIIFRPVVWFKRWREWQNAHDNVLHGPFER